LKESEENKPKIAISIGDINGIGPEIIIKTLSHPSILKLCTPIIYTPGKVIAYYKKMIGQNDFNYLQVNDIEKIDYNRVNVVNTYTMDFSVEVGKVTEVAGEISFVSLEKATNDLVDGKVDALVTAPINKQNIQRKEFQHAGHTGYITEKAGANESLMMMVGQGLRVALATTHIPISEVASKINRKLLFKKLLILKKTLQEDFGIEKPKIALMGLDPHAGDNGVIGTKDKELIEPLIQEIQEQGGLVYGPFATDGFFGAYEHKKYDAILGMYHDQVLTPFKLLHFEDGVNYTAGLPIVRTSPDHGTAYGIAGKGIANEGSFRTAFFMAIEISKNRSKKTIHDKHDIK